MNQEFLNKSKHELRRFDPSHIYAAEDINKVLLSSFWPNEFKKLGYRRDRSSSCVDLDKIYSWGSVIVRRSFYRDANGSLVLVGANAYFMPEWDGKTEKPVVFATVETAVPEFIGGKIPKIEACHLFKFQTLGPEQIKHNFAGQKSCMDIKTGELFTLLSKFEIWKQDDQGKKKRRQNEVDLLMLRNREPVMSI